MIMNDEIVIYKSEDGIIKVDVLFADETVWLTQRQMSELFQRDISVISRHISNVFQEGELDEEQAERIILRILEVLCSGSIESEDR